MCQIQQRIETQTELGVGIFTLKAGWCHSTKELPLRGLDLFPWGVLNKVVIEWEIVGCVGMGIPTYQVSNRCMVPSIGPVSEPTKNKDTNGARGQYLRSES